MEKITGKLSNKLRNMSFVCACFVAVMHIRPVFQESTISWYVKQFIELGVTYISLPFFFAASGFFLAGNYLTSEKITNAYFAAIEKRLASLLAPYFLWMLLWWFMTLIVPSACQYLKYGTFHISLPISYTGWAKILGLSPLGITNLSVLWFVRNLMFLVLLSPVIFMVLRRFGMCFLVPLFALYVMTYPWPERLFPRNLGDLLFFNGLPSLVGFFWFSLGMALRIKTIHVSISRRSIVLCMILGLVLSGLRAAFVLQGRSLPVAACGFASMCCYLYSVWGIMPDAAWPKWLVTCSFPIYLMHKFVLYVSNLVVANLGGDSLFSYGLESLFGCGMPIVAALFLRKYFPRIASIAFGGR